MKGKGIDLVGKLRRVLGEAERRKERVKGRNEARKCDK